ncbi:MAG: hypothetical protein JRJ47_08430 [Deltaproteobacteria bacterium]|nr:hypothetical protein [Deltaproteobacteria bacterium]
MKQGSQFQEAFSIVLFKIVAHRFGVLGPGQWVFGEEGLHFFVGPHHMFKDILFVAIRRIVTA